MFRTLRERASDLSRKSEASQPRIDGTEWFTEGFDTADLKEAKLLLDELK